MCGSTSPRPTSTSAAIRCWPSRSTSSYPCGCCLAPSPSRRSGVPRALRREPVNARRAELRRIGDALDSHESALAVDRDLLGFSRQSDASARRLVEWLRSGKVQVRRLEDRFLHGKAFLVATHAHGVVSGSSNFTHAGLCTNLELNLGNYTPHTVDAVAGWFDELWDSAADYDLAALFEPRFEPHPPQLIYLRMLWERYQAELAADDEAAVPRSSIELTSFQRDGLLRARRLLDEFNGVLVADEVGLGKTYFAGKLIEEAAIENRQRVLVVCPATLRDGPWKAFRQQHNLPMTLISFDELAADPSAQPRTGPSGRRSGAATLTPNSAPPLRTMRSSWWTRPTTCATRPPSEPMLYAGCWPGCRRRSWCCSPPPRSTTASGTCTACSATFFATTECSPPTASDRCATTLRRRCEKTPVTSRPSTCSTCSTRWRCAAPAPSSRSTTPTTRCASTAWISQSCSRRPGCAESPTASTASCPGSSIDSRPRSTPTPTPTPTTAC